MGEGEQLDEPMAFTATVTHLRTAGWWEETAVRRAHACSSCLPHCGRNEQREVERVEPHFLPCGRLGGSQTETVRRASEAPPLQFGSASPGQSLS